MGEGKAGGDQTGPGHAQQGLFQLLLMGRGHGQAHILATGPQRSRWGPEQMPEPTRGPLYLPGQQARFEVGPYAREGIK